MASVTGRGRGREPSDSINAKVLRRPGEAGLMQRLETLNTSVNSSTRSLNEKFHLQNDIKNEVSGICERLADLDFNSKEELTSLSDKIRSLCQSVDTMEKCIDHLYAFAVKSKWNAHVAALFCNSISDITVQEAKFRTYLLRKLQTVYKERNKKYLELEKFLMDVTFLCEVFHHIRIEGKCMKVLSRPVNDYFGMLIDGASQKEVEILFEQFPKCYYNLKENDQPGLDSLVCKLRKQIICEQSNVIVRSMLLEIFEHILTNFEPLSDTAKNLYESYSKPPVKICE